MQISTKDILFIRTLKDATIGTDQGMFWNIEICVFN